MEIVFGAFGVLGTLIAGIALWWTWRSRRSEAARDDREAQMSEDIAILSETVAALAEETRGRRPRPTILWSLRNGTGDSAVYDRPPLRPIDVESIVAAEEAAALATLLPIGTGAHVGLAFSAWSNPGVTEHDHKSFRKDVELYKQRLRQFLADFESYRSTRALLVVGRLHVNNDGGGPAEHARVRLHFPDPFEQDEWPNKPAPPRRPAFEPPRDGPMTIPRSLLRAFDPMPPVRFEPLDPGDPVYEDGSVIVRFNYRSIPHRDPFVSNTFVLNCKQPGTYVIPWTVHAANLPQPERGELRLTIQQEEPAVEPITTLAELLQDPPDEE